MEFDPSEVQELTTTGIGETLRVGGVQVTEDEWKRLPNLPVTKEQTTTKTFPFMEDYTVGQIVAFYDADSLKLLRKQGYRITSYVNDDWKQVMELTAANNNQDITCKWFEGRLTIYGPNDIEKRNNVRVVGVSDHYIASALEMGHLTVGAQL